MKRWILRAPAFLGLASPASAQRFGITHQMLRADADPTRAVAHGDLDGDGDLDALLYLPGETGSCGGGLNQATGSGAVVVGGYGNPATGSLSAMGGGNGNMANGEFSVVSGGCGQVALGDRAHVR